MSSPGGGGGGGGINLPYLLQQIRIQTSVNGNATAQVGNVTQAVNNATTAVGGMTGAWGGMYGAINRTIPTWRATGDALRMTGSLLTYQVAMPLKIVGKAAIDASRDFEKSMHMIQGLVGIAGSEVDKMGKKVLNMAGDVGKAPTELADALYYITSAGITETNVALDTLNTSARAASAGLGTTKDVANLSTSVMNAYAPGMYNAAVATDALVAAVREGKADAAEFAPAMGKVIPVAAAFGVKFQDVAAAVAALTRQGAPAGTAAIQLRQILGSLLNPTQKATEELSKYGMSTTKLRDTIQQKGLLAGLSELRTAFGDNAAALTQVFGNIRPLQAIMALIGPSFEKNAGIFDRLSQSAGDTDKAFEVMTETLGFKLNQASAEGKVALVKIGDSLAPVIKIFADFGRIGAEVLQFFGSFGGGILVKAIALMGGAAIAMTALVKTFATFIRMRSYTTIALQGITNGLRDQTTGMVTNIQTGTSYATTMGIATTATGGLGTAAGAAATPMGALAITMGELTAYIVELMAVMTENSVITAENTMMMEQLIIAQGGVSTAVTVTTADVLAGNTAMAAWASSTMTATGAATGLTGATTGATAATTAGTAATTGATAATTAATAANITMGNSIIANMRAALVARSATTGLTVAQSSLGVVVQTAAISMKTAAIAAKSMVTSMLPMLAITVAVWGAWKLLKFALSSGNKEVNNSFKAMQGLTDSLSNYRVAPIVIGIDVQYTVDGGQTTGGTQDSVVDNFRKFLFNEDKDGKPSEQGKKIQKEIDGFAEDVNNGVLTGQKKIDTAVGLVQMFGADTKTRYDATQYFAKRFQIDPKALEAEVTKSSSSAKGIFEANIVRFSKEIADNQTDYDFSSYLGKGISGTEDYFSKIFQAIGSPTGKDWEKGLGADALVQVGEDIKNTGDGMVAPLTNALASSGGSSEQFVGSLEAIHDAALKATGSEKFAEGATLKFAKAAFKAADMSDKGSTVAELFANNSDKLNSSMSSLSDGVKRVTGETNAANISTKEIIDTYNNNFKPVTDGAVRDIQGVATVIGTLKAAFDGGLNPFVQDAADIMDGYTEALKNAKKGQDALFGSQLSLIDSQANYGTAISTALTDIGKAGGDITGFSAESLKAQQSLGGIFKAVEEVANATYANTTGTAEERQAAAQKAAADYIDAANKALVAKGGISQQALDNFWGQRLGKQLTVGGETIKANAEYLGMTFGQNDVVTKSTTDAATSAGTSTVAGVTQGVTDGQADLEKAATDSAEGVVKAYTNYLKIKSPSRVMYDRVGMPIIEGLKKALVDGKADLAEAATNTAKTTVSTIKATTEKEMNGLNLLKGIFTGTTTTTTTTTGTGDGTSGGDAASIAAAAAAAAQKEKERKDALAKSVKLKGKKVGANPYDILATNLAGKGASAIFKKGGKSALENYAEGVLSAQGKVKTNVTKLVKAIVGEVNEKLSTFSATITAQLNLSGAKNDLAKFMVKNTPEMLAASVAAATRAVTQSEMKYGAGQGTSVTQYERSKISTARAASEQAQRDYRLGKISYADMIDAQTEYANVQAAASEASSENADATTNLMDATYQQQNSAALLAVEQMKVVSAQNELTTAYINANTAGSDLKDTLASVAAQAGVASSGLMAVFSALAGKSATEMGLSTNMGTLLGAANAEANNASLTNTPSTTPTASGTTKAVLPSVKPAHPKTGAMYRNSKGVAFRWNGKSWVRVPGYAQGGNIMPGQLSMVGENGPELIRPASAMNVTPFSVLEQYARVLAHGGSGGGYDSNGSNINITVNNPVPERASDSISRRMQNLSSLGLFG